MPEGKEMGMGWGGDMSGWCGQGFGGVFMLVFWVLVAVGIFLLVRGFASRSGSGGKAVRPETPLEILKRRYAMGEIDKAEFEEKRKALTE